MVADNTITLPPFRKILDQGLKGGSFNNVVTAKEWLRKTAATTNVSAQQLIKMDPKRYSTTMNSYSIGRMFLFQYDPKTKEKLPYWDKFPLIFPIAIYNDGFLGLNMHYLPPPLRAILMDNLYDIANNKRYDDSTRLMMTYKLLSGTAKFKHFKPTIHRYLNIHCRSKFVYIAPHEWNMALFLPIARFQKASASKVYADSVNKIN
jgi:hypothetical protein